MKELTETQIGKIRNVMLDTFTAELHRYLVDETLDRIDQIVKEDGFRAVYCRPSNGGAELIVQIIPTGTESSPRYTFTAKAVVEVVTQHE